MPNNPSPPNTAGAAAAPRPAPLKNVAPELTKSGKKRQAGVDGNPWEQYGRGYTRIHNFIDPTGKIMEEGMQLEKDLEDDDAEEGDEKLWEQLTGPQRRWVTSWRPLFKKLRSAAPDALTDVTKATSICESIDRGRAKAKQTDTNSIKARIPAWVEKQYGVQEKSLTEKVDRGYKHPLTAKLLTPASLQWSEENRLKLLNRKIKVAGDNWPRCMYKDIDNDPSFLENDPWEGLFMNPLLVMCYKHIFTSPSSADKENVEEAVTTRAGNAAIHGMDEVTVGSLAYVAAQLRFALSSSGAFSRTDPNADVTGFYGSVYNLLTDPDEDVNVARLLKWWNHKIFLAGSTQVLSAESSLNYFHAAAKRRKEVAAAARAAAAPAAAAAARAGLEIDELD